MTPPGEVSRRAFLELTGLAAAGVALGSDTRDDVRGGRAPGEPALGAGLRVNAAVPAASPLRGNDAAADALEATRADGVDLAFVPVAGIEGFEASARNLLRLHDLVIRREDAVYVRGAGDLEHLGDGRTIGIVPTFQGMEMIVEALDLVPVFRRAGVGVVALTHAWKNWNGDGCFEPKDHALTVLGRMAVRALNDAGVLLDLSRAGRRTSLEAMEVSRRPVVFTHSNAAAIHPHPRNLTDRQIDVCARTGGVVCVTAFPAFVTDGRPSLEAMLRHVDHVAERVGASHVGLGLDVDARPPIRFDSDPLPELPYEYPAGLSESAPAFRVLEDRLDARGYAADEIEGILGGNLVRVLIEAWSA